MHIAFRLKKHNVNYTIIKINSMENKTLIAQVDNATGQIMREISEDIRSAIDDNLRGIKTKIGNIDDVINDEIIGKLNDFDGLSSSLAELKELARESKNLAKSISPLDSQLSNIKTLVNEGFKENRNKAQEVISSVKDNLTYNQQSLHPLSQLANEKLDLLISSLPNSLKGSENNITQVITNGVKSIEKAYNEAERNIQDNINKVSQTLKEVEESIKLMLLKSGELETRIHNLEAIAEQNNAHHNELKESVEKIQVTLDIVVSLTTPFWKKWGK